MSLFSWTMALYWWPEIRVVLFTQARLHVTECSEAYQHLYDTCLCPRSRLISWHLLDVFIIKSGDTDQVENKGSHLHAKHFNSSGYLNHLQIFLSLFFIFSWTHFLYFPVSHLKSPAHTWENNPSDSPTQESYFRPLLHSSLRNAEQTQKSKHWKWVKIHLNP